MSGCVCLEWVGGLGSPLLQREGLGSPLLGGLQRRLGNASLDAFIWIPALNRALPCRGSDRFHLLSFSFLSKVGRSSFNMFFGFGLTWMETCWDKFSVASGTKTDTRQSRNIKKYKYLMDFKICF